MTAAVNEAAITRSLDFNNAALGSTCMQVPHQRLSIADGEQEDQNPGVQSDYQHVSVRNPVLMWNQNNSNYVCHFVSTSSVLSRHLKKSKLITALQNPDLVEVLFVLD